MGSEYATPPPAEGMYDYNKVRVIHRWQVDDLVGKLLTYVDATYSDEKQREAHKSIVRNTVYPWFIHGNSMAIKDKDMQELVMYAINQYLKGECIACGSSLNQKDSDPDGTRNDSGCHLCPREKFTDGPLPS